MSYETLEAAVQSLVSTNASLVAAVTQTQLQANEAIDEAAASINVTAANVMAAQTHANNAAASAGTVTGVQAAAAASAATATSKAAEATASAAAAASAVLGQTTSKLDISAIDQTVFASTTLVDAVIYDTSKDSDGGAWRKRCQDKSWYQEAINGKWLGSAASEAAARAISGATTNDYYYDTTAAKFYALSAGSGRTEVFRGNVREFPARVLVTSEASRIVIWDMTQPGCPMWMVFVGADNRLISSGAAATYTLSALNGMLAVAASPGGGLNLINFLTDTRLLSSSSVTANTGYFKAGISGRNSGAGSSGTNPVAIVSATCHDVALTVLPDAPIDPSTGLPVPTIAVATGNGLSIIKHDGGVVSVTDFAPDGANAVWVVQWVNNELQAFFYTSPNQKGGCAIYSPAGTFIRGYRAQPANYGGYKAELAPAPNVMYPIQGARSYAKTVPGAIADQRYVGASWVADSGIRRFRENPSDATKGMVFYATKDNVSGWLPGDARGAWINRADGVSETLADTELVINGAFDTDAGGWTAGGGATLSVASGELTITNAAGAGHAAQAVSTVAGKAYRVSAQVRKGTGTYGAYLLVGTSSGGNQLGSAVNTSSANAELVVEFVATGASTYVSLTNSTEAGGTGVYDNVSVRELVADRSAKNKGLVVAGTLSRAPVATGAGLGAISGFSVANYLERAYTSDLDFGTAAFAFLVPLTEAPNSADEVVFERGYHNGSAYSGARIRLEVLAAGTLKATFSDGSSNVTLTSTNPVDDSTWRTGLVVGFDGTNFRLVGSGGRDLATPATRGSVGSLSNANAVLRVGLGVDGALPLTNGAVSLLRATAMWPSADQLTHIYETERKLFEPNAQCALAGTSNVVTALAYDEDTDLLHVGTSWGRSAFQGLLRVSSEATPVGSLKALAASGGAVAQAGDSAVDVYLPAYSLREELERLDDAARVLGSQPVFHEFDATTGQTAFVLPVGFRVVGVYSAGALKRVGNTKDYTTAFDGFRWTVNFAVAPGNGTWVSIMTVRA